MESYGLFGPSVRHVATHIWGWLENSLANFTLLNSILKHDILDSGQRWLLLFAKQSCHSRQRECWLGINRFHSFQEDSWQIWNIPIHLEKLGLKMTVSE